MHSTLRNACSAPRRWFFLSWLLALPLFDASAQFLAAAPARANPPGEAAAAAELPFALYITTNMKDVAESDAVEQASVLVEHRALLKCTSLSPGKTYRCTWSLKDSNGVELLGNREFVFAASKASAWLPKLYVPPDQTPTAGNWTWKVTVDGMGTFSKQITMLPPTKDEAEKLAAFQQVRENVLHVFALSWRYHDGGFFTVVGEGSSAEKMIEVVDLSPHFTHEHVSPAERLNGITYRGKATFSFTVWREYTSDGGWTEWEDVTKYSNDFTERFGNALIANVPKSFQKNFNLGFGVYLKDGHCKVVSDDTTEFLDRRQITTPDRTIHSPTKEFLRKAVSEGDSLRKRERAAAEKLRGQPETAIDGIKETSDAIRGTLGPLQSILLWNNVEAPSMNR